MKQIKLLLLGSAVALLLGACGAGNNSSSGSSETQVTTEESNSSSTGQSWSGGSDNQSVTGTSIFTATLVEDAAEIADDGTTRLTLKTVEAVEDPEAILPMMQNDGVVLNVTPDQLAEGLTMDQLKSGDQVRFTLSGLPVMTMSIPPQIAGNAVKVVEKLN